MQLSQNNLQKNLAKFADNYDQYAFLQKEIGNRLVQRLDYCKLQPDRILDLGSGAGGCTVALQNKYSEAELISLDISSNMLHLDKAATTKIQSDATDLPFTSNSFDLIFSNLLLHWVPDINRLINECKRVLTKHGLLIFSTVGENTLCELRQAFLAVDDFVHVHKFLNLITIGDLFLKKNFLDPVVDIEEITVEYENINSLFVDLKNTGAANIALDRRRGLLTKANFQKVQDNYPKNASGLYPATYEIIFGHALRN